MQEMSRNTQTGFDVEPKTTNNVVKRQSPNEDINYKASYLDTDQPDFEIESVQNEHNQRKNR